MSEENPCNLCNMDCFETDCVLHRYNKLNYCKAYDCFLNYEGSCLIDIIDDCGCRKQFDGEQSEKD